MVTMLEADRHESEHIPLVILQVCYFTGYYVDQTYVLTVGTTISELYTDNLQPVTTCLAAAQWRWGWVG